MKIGVGVSIAFLIFTMAFPMVAIPVLGIGVLLWVGHVIFSTLSKKIRKKQ